MRGTGPRHAVRSIPGKLRWRELFHISVALVLLGWALSWGLQGPVELKRRRDTYFESGGVFFEDFTPRMLCRFVEKLNREGAKDHPMNPR